ncbi:Transcriptional regulator, TetR family [Streptomyces sp. YIM 130001]|uniref:TetR/AcrR family transcriptional regulator n=1 Tax=Streptomyces sp. YIM 130001 TaxID=2259644 RepID=UPI000EDD39F7|nr:TetR/AcrR family transcriptional regulator [Streptomyces sp. YIM 130001]RII20597.1 Transcriptional regulator, TetR family [Streptomyces sp. YIM 130001]
MPKSKKPFSITGRRLEEAALKATRQLSRTGRSPRHDTVRNRGKILEAVGEMLTSEPGAVSMPLIAKRAGLSVATVYRYFASAEDAIGAYVFSTILELRNYSHDCPLTGTALFEAVVAERVRLVPTYGAATVQVRSRQGFLARLDDQDELITAVRDIWERPIRGVLRHFAIPDAHFDHALFLYNMMFDPREILDLIRSGLTEADTALRLTRAYYGALNGWADADKA